MHHELNIILDKCPRTHPSRRGLAGKPGAARKELKKLLEERAAQDESAAEEARKAAERAARTATPLEEDEVG